VRVHGAATHLQRSFLNPPCPPCEQLLQRMLGACRQAAAYLLSNLAGALDEVFVAGEFF
jgi:hypothetical protein